MPGAGRGDSVEDCIHLLASMEKDGSEDLADARKLLESLQGGCSAGTRVANIDTRGNVYPCQFARSPEFLVGNIRDRSFSRIWADGENPVLARFRKKDARFSGWCGMCTYRDLCGGGCRVRAHAVEGDFLAEDPFCFLEDIDLFEKNRTGSSTRGPAIFTTVSEVYHIKFKRNCP